MNVYGQAFLQGCRGALRLYIDLIRAPFIAWAIVSRNFFEESDAALESRLEQALRRETDPQ